MTEIKSDIHYNKEVYLLENHQLRVKVLKDFGAKIVSIYHREKDYELVFQPTDKSYNNPKLGDAFQDYDTSGIDEMLPTIDQCFYPNSYKKLNDHGDIWSQRWDQKVENNSLISRVRSDSLKLNLERRLDLVEDEIRLSYRLTNPTNQDHFYLWAFHGLLNFDESTELILPEDNPIINVIDHKAYDFNWRKLGDYPDRSSYKFYFQDELKDGRVAVYHRSKDLTLEYKYPKDINKYLGVWITKGGFKGEYNLAIEPASGYYDSLDRAFKNNKCSTIGSGKIKTWDLTLKIY